MSRNKQFRQNDVDMKEPSIKEASYANTNTVLALAAHMAKTKENGHPPLDDDQMQSHSSDSSDSSDNDGDDNETATEYIVTSPQSPVAVAVAESNGTNGGDGGGGGAYNNITANNHSAVMKENTDEEKYPLKMDIVVNQIIGEGVNLGNGNKIYLLKCDPLWMSEEDAANKVPILLQRYNEQKVIFIARKFVNFVRFEEKEDASHTKSAVWEFFNRRSNTEAVCECCHTLIARKTNSTHSLWKHLKNEHPDEHKTAEQKRDEAATERRKIATTKKESRVGEQWIEPPPRAAKKLAATAMHSGAPVRTFGSANSAKRRRSSVGTGSAITLPYVTPIWDHFSKETAADVDATADESLTGNEKRNVATANCNLCKKSVSVKSMWNHLKSQHAAEYAIASQKKKNTSVGGGGGDTAPVAVAADTKEEPSEPLWDFFIKMEVNDDNTSQCKLCDEHVEMNELWSHLAKNHPEQHKLANDKDKTASADVVKPLKLESQIGKNDDVTPMKKGSAKKQKSTPKPPRRRVSIVSTGGASGGGQTPSAVWKFFLKQQDKQSSKCSLCGQIISLSSSSTSSMWRHLKSEHPPEFQQARSVLIGGNHLASVNANAANNEVTETPKSTNKRSTTRIIKMEALATDESEKTSATVGDEVSEKRGRGRPLSKRQTRGIKRPNEDDQTPKVSTRKQRKQSTTAGQATGTGSVPMEIEKDSAAEDNRPGPSSQTPATVATGEAVAGTSGTGGDGYTMSSDESDDEDDVPESSTDSSDPDYQ